MLCMYRLGSILFCSALLSAAPALYNSTSDSSWRNWTALDGTAQSDSAARHENRATLRVEPQGGSDALVRSAPVPLRPGKHYELSGWVRTEGLQVRDSGRSTIAVGAVLAMGSMPFDVHSESVAGTHEWTHLKLRFTATRTQDSILLRVAEGGAFSGRAWFDGITIEEVSAANSGPAPGSVQVFGPGYRYPSAGWIYLHIEGKPYERGYQHGYLLHKEIERYMERCASQLDAKSRESAWANGRITADALFTRGFDDEIREEMQGIADGAAAAGGKWHGRKIDLIDIVTANTITELGELHGAMPVTPTGLEGLGFKLPEYARELPVTDRCSSFAATGKATRDGHMIVAHTTWWPLTLAEQTNIMLDMKPASGHRVLMQAYPGGIQSGTDWYQNDAGIVLTETTIRQTPFNREGTPVAFRARKAIQYGEDIDQVVRHLSTRNNGLYTNEWIIGDAKNDEIAMFELGTYKTKLWRSSRNEWFGGTEGFYWGNNNGKDPDLRLEYQPDPKGKPADITFSPAPRDIRWQELYRQYKGTIDEQFAFLAFRSGPLVSASAMDAKVATAEMASNMMVWAAIGKPNQRERLPGQWDGSTLNDGLYPSGYKLFTTIKPSSDHPVMATQTTPVARAAIPSARLWRGWLLPAADADLWLTAGSAVYHDALASDKPEDEITRLRIHARGDVLLGGTPLSQLHSSLESNLYSRLARHKGALALDALRSELGDENFLSLMDSFYTANTTKGVTTAAFRAATEKTAGKPMGAFFTAWLEQAGIPGDPGGPAYLVSDLASRFASTLIVYGTMAEAGSNRYAAEQFLLHDMSESSPLIKKDFELTEEDMRTHDVVFIGRPESNQALARYADRLGLGYSGAAFTASGKQHASEYESLAFAAPNPLNPKCMVIVLAGNSALGTVKVAKRPLAEDAMKVYDDR